MKIGKRYEVYTHEEGEKKLRFATHDYSEAVKELIRLHTIGEFDAVTIYDRWFQENVEIA